jgi:hypothetical protein
LPFKSILVSLVIWFNGAIRTEYVWLVVFVSYIVNDLLIYEI